MKASNIFQSLRSKGVCGTDGIPPKLPGVSAAKFNTGLREASAAGKLNPEFKAAVDADTEKKSSPANYGAALKKKKHGKLISKVYNPKTGITTAKYDVGTNMPKIVRTKSSPATKKSCGYKK